MSHNSDLCKIEGHNHGFLITFLGKKHTLWVLKALSDSQKPLRFGQIQKRLNVNTKTLTDRLRELEDAHFITRRSFDQIPPRVEYSLTIIGWELKPLLDEMAKFERKYFDNRYVNHDKASILLQSKN